MQTVGYDVWQFDAGGGAAGGWDGRAVGVGARVVDWVGVGVKVAIAVGGFPGAVGEGVAIRGRSVAAGVGRTGSASASPAQDPKIAAMNIQSV